MKRIELITTNDRLINFRISEIAAVLERHSRGETAIYLTGSDDAFIVRGFYAEIMERIEEVEHVE